MKLLNIIKKLFFLYSVFLILFSTCSQNKTLIKKPENIPSVNLLYKLAFKEFENGNFQESVDLFQKIETRYSFSEWSPRATLMILYIYYESGEYIKSLEYIKKYKKLYPASNYLDYIDYISGLIFYEQINIVSRDQTYSHQALKIFKKILKDHPNSKYAEDVFYKIDLINEQLAGKEMYIARYYMKKSKWIAAIRRLKLVVKDYNQTIYSKEALHRLVEIYYRLGNIDESKKYAAILGYNFNDSDWYKKSYKIVGNKDYRIIEKKQKMKLKDRVKKIFNFSNDK